MVDAHVVRTHDAGDAKYARIKFPDSTRDCPFLTSERWCRLHKEYGAEYLSPVCFHYPRVRELPAGMSTTPLLLSCPEAARVVLLQPELVPIERNAADGRPDYRRFLRMAERAHGKPPRKALSSDVMEFSLLVIQDRAYPIWQRLFVLGMLSKRLTERETPCDQLVASLLGEYAVIVKEGRLRAVMDGIAVQTGPQLSAVIEVAHRLQTEYGNSARIQECIRDFMHGICYEARRPVEEMAPTYSEVYERYYRPFFEQHPYILENYLSNYVFWTQFPRGPIPAGEPNTPLTACILMCLKFAVIKGLLIGMAGHYRESFAAEHVVKLVQCFSKKAEHAAKFLSGINHDLASAGGMALLLKN
jgi:lysine-N-methylase